jgi:hypothetical protein
MKNDKKEKRERHGLSLSVWSLLFTITSVLVGGAYYFGQDFGKSSCDKCCRENDKLKQELSLSKDFITTLKDSINHLCQCPDTTEVYDIFVGHLSQGLDMGIATSGNKTGWLQVANGEIKMDYPSGQNWGTVFITVGKPAPLSKREKRDFSRYKTLLLELKGSEGSVVEIGLKDNRDADTGLETKIPLTLKEDWTSYQISLDKFLSADLKNLYTVIEFVFTEKAQTVYAKKIQFRE